MNIDLDGSRIFRRRKPTNHRWSRVCFGILSILCLVMAGLVSATTAKASTSTAPTISYVDSPDCGQAVIGVTNQGTSTTSYTVSGVNGKHTATGSINDVASGQQDYVRIGNLSGGTWSWTAKGSDGSQTTKATKLKVAKCVTIYADATILYKKVNYKKGKVPVHLKNDGSATYHFTVDSKFSGHKKSPKPKHYALKPGTHRTVHAAVAKHGKTVVKVKGESGTMTKHPFDN